MKIENFPVNNALGESPLWVADEQALYWVDYDNAAIWRWFEANGERERFNLPDKVSALARCADGRFLLAAGLQLLFWRPGAIPQLAARLPEPSAKDVRLNDGKVDPAERFWVGEIDRVERQGRLFRFDPDLSLHEMDRGFVVANGIAWSLDNRTMYLVDSRAYALYAYDFDLDSGSIRNRRVLVSFPAGPVVPDGLTVDEGGFLWVVLCRGAMVERYDPSGKLDRQIPLPAKAVTSCMFGGRALDRLFITSARALLPAEESAIPAQAGDLFVIDPGVRGRPENLYGATRSG